MIGLVAWATQIADQRPARFPVTFALMTVLMREHNRCCDDLAVEWGASDDEVRPSYRVSQDFNGCVRHRLFVGYYEYCNVQACVTALCRNRNGGAVLWLLPPCLLLFSYVRRTCCFLFSFAGMVPWVCATCPMPSLRPRLSPYNQETYQFCRQWNIAVFQHISENDFSIRLVGGSVKASGSIAYDTYHDDDEDADETTASRRRRLQRRRLGALEPVTRSSRYLAQTNGSYDVTTTADVDVLFSTVALPAFYSALPPTVDLRDEKFEAVGEVRCG